MGELVSSTQGLSSTYRPCAIGPPNAQAGCPLGAPFPDGRFEYISLCSALADREAVLFKYLGWLIVSGIYWWLSQRRSAWMTRKHLVTLTWQIALTLATVGVMYGVLFDDVISIRRSIVYMMVGLFLGGTVTTITGDMLSWIRGGYASELPKGKWNRRYPNR